MADITFYFFPDKIHILHADMLCFIAFLADEMKMIAFIR